MAALGLMTLMPVVTVAYSLVGEATERLARVSPPFERPTPATVVAVDSAPKATPVQTAVGATLRADAFRLGIVTVWLFGVLTFTAINTGGWLQIRRLRRSGVPVEDPAWNPWIAELRDRLGIKRLVAVLGSTRVDVPTVLGWARPVVLVPASALLGMNSRSLEALLLHELAHIRRHDLFVNLVQAAVETLLFYHPAVWWVSERVRCEREHCCDDLAVGLCGSRQDYVRALADMEKLRLATPKMAIAADGGSLVERIRRLTGSTPQRNGGSTRWAMGIGILALALTVGAVQFAASPFANARPADASGASVPTASSLPSASAGPESESGSTAVTAASVRSASATPTAQSEASSATRPGSRSATAGPTPRTVTTSGWSCASTDDTTTATPFRSMPPSSAASARTASRASS